ncbi:hypothetical protein ABT369_24370 [Dactylosporangium sp. NPDC000244]|uniref:hypothetical protein n=1 Tax=Dactylosporangium sp. NPDC000244 TaxID=3154365 RepID=UPI00332C033C
MTTITDVPTDAYNKVHLLAIAWGVTDGVAVARLVEHFAKTPGSAKADAELQVDEVAIYAIYEGTKVEAVYNRKTKSVAIISGKLKNKTYSTPSGAAVAVVAAHNPTVNPNRNGWSFWVLADNGEILQTIR